MRVRKIFKAHPSRFFADSQVKLAYKEDNKVLIWSFTDSLSPKLTLECSREVTTVSVCPLDSSIVIGGCANGQVIPSYDRDFLSRFSLSDRSIDLSTRNLLLGGIQRDCAG